MLALRVFEVRYLDMVRKCHQAGAPFGIVGLRSGQESVVPGSGRATGMKWAPLATIEELQSPQPGLIQLLCRGDQRFRIVQSRLLPTDSGWPTWGNAGGRSACLRAGTPCCDHTRAGTGAGLAARTRSHQPCSHRTHGCATRRLRLVANRWCELLPVPLELKQRLMQLDNPLVRLELVGDVLERTGIAPL